MSREKLRMRVEKGCLVPADDYTAERLRERGYKIGDEVAVTISKSRTAWFNRQAHKLGQLCVTNIEELSGYEAHGALKRLQIESGVACEETAIKAPGFGMLMHRVPRSLSFDEMDEGEFRQAILGLCRYIAKTYWPSMTEDQIYQMAEVMP